MKMSGQILEYLNGNNFSNSLAIPYDFKDRIPDRVSFLREKVRGTNVIHLGCLDHLPLIDDKIARGQWLHQELTNSASKCIGIDVDREAWNYVKNKHGVNNIIIADFANEKPIQILKHYWDYAVLGELLEHIDNPVAFLTSIRENYADCLDKIIITVPNAWTRTTIKMALASTEIINSDHRYWFTPYTLSKVVVRAGMVLHDIYFTNRVPLTITQLIHNKLLKLLGKEPYYNFTFASSIVVIASLK